MKRGRALFLIAAVLFGLAFVVVRAQEDEPEPVRILIVGDSMTQGSAGDYTWRYRLAKYLDESGVYYDLVGPSDALDEGSTAYVDPEFDTDHDAAWGASYYGSLVGNATTPERSIAWVVATYQPDIVVSVLGFNDLAFRSDPDQTLVAAKEWVQQARQPRPGVAILLATVPSVASSEYAVYNDKLRSAAVTWSEGSSTVTLADPVQGWTTEGSTYDGTHPNARGEVLLAAAVVDALASMGVGSPAPRPLPEPPLGPRQPATLSAEPGNGEVRLWWNSPAGSDATFVWTRDVTSDSEWQRLPLPLPGNSWVAGGLVNRHRYAFRLQSAKGTSVAAGIYSNVVIMTPRRGA